MTKSTVTNHGMPPPIHLGSSAFSTPKTALFETHTNSDELPRPTHPRTASVLEKSHIRRPSSGLFNSLKVVSPWTAAYHRKVGIADADCLDPSPVQSSYQAGPCAWDRFLRKGPKIQAVRPRFFYLCAMRVEMGWKNLKGVSPIWTNPLIFLVRLQGLEPRTHGLEGRCSIHLSYRRAREMCG